MINIEISNMKALTGYTAQEKTQIIEDLTFNNPAYSNAVRHSKWGSSYISLPKYLSYYIEEDNTLYVPRGYVPDTEFKIVDDYSFKNKVDYPKFRMKLRDTQREAILAFLQSGCGDGVIVLPTGKGKSITAIYLAYHLRQKALVIVQKDDLITNWKADIQSCLGLRNKQIGLIKAQNFRIGKQITLCTIQTLAKLSDDQINELTEEFGMIIQDEFHHSAAKIYSLINEFPARYRIGLTATDIRNDGLQDVLNLYFGEVIFRYEEQEEDDDIIPVNKVNVHCLTANSPYFKPEREYYSYRYKRTFKIYELYELLPKNFKNHPEAKTTKYLKALLEQGFFGGFKLIPLKIDDIRKAIIYNQDFLEQIAAKIVSEYVHKRNIVVFCHEKEQCRELYKILDGPVSKDRIQFFYGDSKVSNEKIKMQAESGEAKITIATLSKATEGTNVKAWDSGFLYGTIGNEKDVIQSIGRLRRRKEGKEDVNWFDYTYPNVAGTKKHSDLRLNLYNEMGFNVQSI